MQSTLVMTVIGRDRPGLVESVAQVVAAHGGNWLESRMARLGGQFAGILRVEVPSERVSALEGALAKLREVGLSVVVHRDEPPPLAPATKLHTLEVSGQDRPGIVRQIAHALAEMGVNVEELSSECRSAAMSGQTVFRAVFRFAVPANSSLSEVRERVERVASDLIVDVTFAEDADRA